MSLKFGYKPIQLEQKDNPLVFIDLKIGEDSIGQVVIELYKHIVPSTAENFRALCTGEYGTNEIGQLLHYKGSCFHKVMPFFMCQGGDIAAFDGSSGYSIYGPQFELENFLVVHNGPGILSMVTVNETFCNSQFIITNTDCPHLDGRSVAFGRVVRGFSCVQEMGRVKISNDIPQIPCIIEDCGAVVQDNHFHECQPDETGDALPHGPIDVHFLSPLTPESLASTVEIIVQSAKFYYHKKKFSKANQKFRKSLRYIEWIDSNLNDFGFDDQISKELTISFKNLQQKTYLNLSATTLELGDAEQCVQYCDKSLMLDKNNVKALFRKAKALRMVNDYTDALNFLQQAHILQPNDSSIESEIREIRNCQSAYLAEEKKLFSKMFAFNK